MMIQYTVNNEDELTEILSLASKQHFFGTCLLRLESAMAPGSETILNSIVGRHPIAVSIPAFEKDLVIAWRNAGADQVLFRADCKDAEIDSLTFIAKDNFQTAASLAQASEFGIQKIPFSIEYECEWKFDYFVSQIRSDREDGLIPTIVADSFGVALGLVYSNEASLREAIKTGTGVYWSRSRQQLWQKGASSGATQRLIRIDADCDGDSIRFLVKQESPGFCHLERRNCFNSIENDFGAIERHLDDRIENAEAGSYTRKLLDDPNWLAAKIREEADELTSADSNEAVSWEASDLIYFTLVRARSRGVKLQDILAELNRRSRKATRRPGKAKKQYQ